jgi:hypothetical protein
MSADDETDEMPAEVAEMVAAIHAVKNKVCDKYAPLDPIRWIGRIRDLWETVSLDRSYVFPARGDGVDGWIVGYTGEGYQTDSVDRSNFRSLKRDYPYLSEVSWTHKDILAVIPERIAREAIDEGETVEDVRDKVTEMFDALGHLGEYPVYDEDDLSKLEWDSQDEAWDACLKADMSRVLWRMTADLDLTDEQEDAILTQAKGIVYEEGEWTWDGDGMTWSGDEGEVLRRVMTDMGLLDGEEVQ